MTSGQMEEAIVLEGLRMKGVGEFGRGVFSEGAEAKPLLQFGSMPTTILLRGEVGTNGLRPYIGLFGGKRDQGRRRPQFGPSRTRHGWRACCDVSYATVWRVADRAGIELTAGREAKGRRLAPEQRARVEAAAMANPEATQEELAQQCGVSRSTVGRVRAAGVNPQTTRRFLPTQPFNLNRKTNPSV